MQNDGALNFVQFFSGPLCIRAAVFELAFCRVSSVVLCQFQFGPMHSYYCVFVIIGFLLIFFFGVDYRYQVTE